MKRITSISIVFVCLFARFLSAEEVKTVQVPDVWKNTPNEIVSAGKGYALYRTWVTIPKEWESVAVELFVEAIDDAREAYVNGVRVGGTGTFPPKFRSGLGDSERFPVPKEVLRFGQTNSIAIRTYQNEGRTGFNVAAPVVFGGDQAIRLEGKWQFHVGDDDAWVKSTSPSNEPHVFGDLQPADVVLKTLKKLKDEDGPLTPQESLARITVPPDLEVQLVLAEPEVRQPLFINFDERGRMWVVQYLQYPSPAGLKMVSRDKFLRTVYDKVPPAPPHHFRGADKITIHEDTDGDGQFDKHSTFVDGLNLVSSFAIGRGGVWVLNPPYLLFYPDRNHDDIPDGDPEVHLEGFGLEDSHSIANSLRWGPDGWLYAAQGSTVTGNIRRPGRDKEALHSLGQLIWRYHPESRRYEIFAEGGGNAFGVEMDAKGRIYSGHNGGDTRGFHYVQGGYYQKGFGKHGPLSNPYTFGYFAQMQHHSVPRFTHTFVIYQGTALPDAYQGRLFGVAPLLSHVVYSEIQPDRSSFKTKDMGLAMASSDSWFRPVDIRVGPEGAIYVADFYEQRIDHGSHYQGRIDKSSGRIFRLQAKGAKATRPVDYSKLSSAELVEALGHPNQSDRQTAQRLLADRRDPTIIPELESRLSRQSGQPALESLWALYVTGGWTEARALRALEHDDPYVRTWTIRLLCDEQSVSRPVLARLQDLAYREPNVEVRSQLACSARRLNAADCLLIVKSLLARSEDSQDIHLPLLLWWAIESKVDSDRDAVLKLFEDPSVWQLPLVKDHVLQRLMKRLAMSGTRKDLLAAARLLQFSGSRENAKPLMTGFEEAYQGRSLRDLPAELAEEISRAGGASLALRLRQREPAAIDEALKLLADDKADARQKQQVVEIVGQLHPAAFLPALIRVAGSSGPEALRTSAIAALQAYDDPQVVDGLLHVHDQLPLDVRTTAQTVLASRKSWTIRYLKALQAGSVSKELVPLAIVKKMLLHSGDEITSVAQGLFGDVQGATTNEMREQIENYVRLLDTASGNPYNGKQLFRTHCGKCHMLFEDGGRIGPDLTSFKRDDLRRVLINVVNPSAEIREGFENFVVQTADGRTLNGFVADQDSQIVALRGLDGQTVVIPRDDIDEMHAVSVSLMPEGLLKPFDDQQVRDLFAYLRSTQPLP